MHKNMREQENWRFTVGERMWVVVGSARERGGRARHTGDISVREKCAKAPEQGFLHDRASRIRLEAQDISERDRWTARRR